MSEFLNGFKRTHTCGALRGTDIGKQVRIVGWVQDYRNLGGFLFLVVRDRYGITQVHIDANSPLFEQASKIRAEWVIGVAGEVISRGSNINKNLPTGEIEIEAKELRIFNRSETTPFAIHDECDAAELMRLKYRYLDLRRPVLNKNIVMRSKITGIIRRANPKISSISKRRFWAKARPKAHAITSCPAAFSPANSMRCRNRRSSSNSSIWFPVSIAIIKSRAASATRICASTVSPNSRRSIWK